MKHPSQQLNLTDFFFDDSILKQDFDSINIDFFESGKKIRGSLILLLGDMLHLEPSSLRTFARVAEMVHNSTLVHDDVIDLSANRRDQATVNQMLGNKKAVLTGDYLLSRSLYELSLENNIAIIQDMAETLRDLVEGEWLQVDPPSLEQVTLDFLITISDKKTSSLLRWCALCPLRISQAKEHITNKAVEFSFHLGVGYQMTDDTLDFSDNSGKTLSLDILNGLPNYVLLEAYKQDPNVIAEIAKVKQTTLLTEALKKSLLRAIPKVSVQAKEHLTSAQKALESMFDLIKRDGLSPKEESLNMIIAFIQMLKQRHS